MALNRRWSVKSLASWVAFLLLAALALIVILARRQLLLWRSRAAVGDQPQQVRITNVTDRSFVVSWLTRKPVAGAVILLTEPKNMLFNDVRDHNRLGNYLSHYVLLAHGLAAGQTYRFKILSAGHTFNNEQYRVKLAPAINGMLPQANLAYGTVQLASQQPLAGALVYFDLDGLAPLSSLSSSTGTWVIPLNVAFRRDLRGLASLPRKKLAEKIIVYSPRGQLTTITNCSDNNHPVPPITIGQARNFCQQGAPAPAAETSPTALPLTAVEQKVSPSPAPFKLFNPGEGERLKTRRPEFFGQAGRGGEVEIELHSAATFRARIPIGDDQRWHWTVPEDLSPGEHTLTLRYRDPNGHEKEIKRHFVVLAAANDEGADLPAFTASASASPAPSPTPTQEPTLTPTLSPDQLASGSVTPIPNTGLGSFSAMLLALALTVFVAGAYLWWLDEN